MADQPDAAAMRAAYGKIVAKAWTDEAFKQRLLSDPAAVLKEEGVTGQIHAALARLLEEGTPPVKPEPMVPVNRSVKRDEILCLECGRGFKTIKRHLSADHRLSPDEYRARYDLNRDYPLVAPAYAAMRSETAKRIGLGRKPGEKPRRRRGAR